MEKSWFQLRNGMSQMLSWGCRNTVDTQHANEPSKQLSTKNKYIYFSYKLDLTKNTAVIFRIPAF